MSGLEFFRHMLDIGFIETTNIGLWFFSDPPSIAKTPSNGLQKAHKGDDVTLSCVGSGNPKPVITWTRLVRHFAVTFAFFCIAKYVQNIIC